LAQITLHGRRGSRAYSGQDREKQRCML
jgi:hypothetical protein